MKIIAIFIISLTLRLLYLGSVPVSLSHDETDNIIQAHSVIQTGSDIEGTWNPWRLLPNSGVMAELGPLINVPVLSLLPQSIFSSRLTTAILSAIFPLLIWWWLTLLKVNSKVAQMSAFLLAISPWHLIFSRSALEQPTSLFFYLLSWVFLTTIFQTNKSRKHYILYSIFFVLSYAVGYFTYHGYKFSFPVLTTIYLAWLSYYSGSHRLVKFGILALFIYSLVVRTLIFSDYYGSRSGEIIFSDQAKFAMQVDNNRRLSIAPESLKSIFVNKPLAMLSVVRDKYLGAISPELLFTRGESNGVFSVWNSGYFYLFTLPFIIMGLVYLCQFTSKESSLILGLLLVSPVATVVHVNNSLAFRSALYFVMLNLVLSYGIVYLFEIVSRYYPKLVSTVKTVIISLFVIGLANFCYNFYFVTPVTNASDYFFADRILSNYARLSTESRLLLVVPQPRYIFSGIILSGGTPTESDMRSFGHSYSPSDASSYKTNNLEVVQSCSKIELGVYDTIIIDKNMLETSLKECSSLTELMANTRKIAPLSIVSPKDSGMQYHIYGDRLCQEVELARYVKPGNHQDFMLEQMTKDEFCTKWIVSQ
ncbi:hypothetical protein KBD75_00495 [Candidatus Woesebacteria bacterium]|nr:hypothetical protein [Candidatus Woesebacteria bacterium]